MEPNKKEREISRDETYTKTWKEKGVSVAFQKEESFHDPGLSTIKKRSVFVRAASSTYS